ncbi:MAG: FAD-dependent oxidoreductase [Clostridia bacterium]|nr:FAD-dependent oxidoreductase [Clostridia bacterium]
MDKQFEPLFTPWKIRNVEIKNRIVMCPMGGTSLFGWMERNHFDKEAAEFFIEKAKNDVGLIIPGIAPIRDLMGGRWLYKNKKMFRELKVFMDEIHKYGAKLFVQLTAGFGRSFAITDMLVPFLKHKALGALIKPVLDISYICASPSEIESRWAEGVKCRALSVKEIEEMIYAFGQTAKLCKEAGVDGVEVHAVHEGYLLDQFTLRYTNKRTDEYGGNFENRYRFPAEIVREIKKECGEDYPVSLRYSVVSKTKGLKEGAIPGEEYEEAGRDLIESKRAAKFLVEAGYDMLNCDNGTYDAWYWAHPPAYMPNNCNLEDVKVIKKEVDVPVVCAGKMQLAESARAIKNKEIDAMGVARQFLVDDKWITKLKNNNLSDIQPCIYCHNGCFAMAHYKGVANDESLDEAKHMARCALNPTTMNGGRFKIEKAKTPKTVAIIGGGIGGMETARILAIRGHKPVIYEKTDHLGGVFIPASAPSFKERDKMLLAWYIKQIKDLNIEVKFNSEIKDINSINADAIVVATGALPKKIKMENGDRIIDATDYLSGTKVGNKVAIIGGGLTGCEIALDLFNHGKTPVIIEAKQDLMAQKGLCLANSSYLRDFFKAKNVKVYLESKLDGIDNNLVRILKDDGTQVLEKVDSIISAIGYYPNPLANESKNIYQVGDCREVGNLRTVIWRAWEVAEKI